MTGPVVAFVRHGETAPNRAGRLLGRGDPPLTDAGLAQAARLAAALREPQPLAVVSSPLRRARDTAEVIARSSGLEVEVDDRLVEIDYGEWEGQRLLDIPADVSARWRADPTFRAPGGESLAEVGSRVAHCVQDLLTRTAPGGESGVVVAVSHVSPIKAAVSWALGVGWELTWRMHLGLASISRVGARPGGPYVLSFNETGHLTAPR